MEKLDDEDIDLIVGLCDDAIAAIDPANAPEGDEGDTVRDRQVYEDLKAKVEGLRGE